MRKVKILLIDHESKLEPLINNMLEKLQYDRCKILDVYIIHEPAYFSPDKKYLRFNKLYTVKIFYDDTPDEERYNIADHTIDIKELQREDMARRLQQREEEIITSERY